MDFGGKKRNMKRKKNTKEKMLNVISNVIGKEKVNRKKMELKHRRQSVFMFIITLSFILSLG